MVEFIDSTDSIDRYIFVDRLDLIDLLTVPNVKSISTKPPFYDKLYIKQAPPSHSRPVFVIDVGMIPAFGHWVFESAIYILTYLRIKAIYSNLKLMVGTYKPYKKLFCKYLNVKDEDILYAIPQGSTCIIPPPLSLTSKSVSDLHRSLIKNMLIPHSVTSTEFLIFPRNRENNYDGNNTHVPYSELISCIERTGIPFRVYDTSTTMNLSSQINLVQQAKVFVIPDGSAFLVNGMFSSCTIYVVGRLCSLEQAKIFPQIKYILDLILERNKVYWFSNQTDFIQFIQTGEYKEPIFIDRPNRSLERWW